MISAISMACSNCVKSPGISHRQAAWKSESFLQGLPREELFVLKRTRSEEATSFRFNESPSSKENHILPTRILVKINPHDEGADSAIKVAARKRGLFFKSKNLTAASKWKEKILGSISKN